MRLRPAWALPLVALLSAPALAAGGKASAAKAPASPPAEAAPASTAPPAVDEKAHTAAFAEYEAQLATGQKARAADALVALLDDPTRQAFDGEAYAKLGDLFADLSLPYAATIAYSRAFDLADPTTTLAIGARVPKALQLATQVGDLALLQKPFAKNVGLAQTDDVRGQMAYLAAKENVRAQSYGVALGILKMVPRGDPLYPESKSLEGVILSTQERWAEALTAFTEAQKASTGKSQDFQDMLALNLARAYYGAGNYPQAMRAFAAVSRASNLWPEAQFERAWAHFRVDDYNGALGQLLSLDNAFFADFYYPEADLLRVYSMFLMCKLPEANTGIEGFGKKYQPVADALKTWGGKSEAETFDAARLFREKGDTGGLPPMILRPWATEQRFGDSIASVQKADDELARLKNVAANPFSDRAKMWITDRRNEVVRAEGGRIKGRISEQQAQLSVMLTDVKIFSVDVGDLNAKILRLAAEIGKMPDAANTVKREDRLRKGWREWPYEGEVWADELGYYRVATQPECPASLRQSVAAPSK